MNAYMKPYNSPDEHSLLEAIENGDSARIADLLQRLDINKILVAEGLGHITPLMMAVDSGNIDTIKLMLDRGADIHKTLYSLKGSARRTALSFAARRGKAAIVRLLLQQGADVNDKGDHGSDYLRFADDPDVEAILREYGARPYARMTVGQVLRTVSGLQNGYSVHCSVCGGDLKYNTDASGEQWHLFCPSGCTDAYDSKEPAPLL